MIWQRKQLMRAAAVAMLALSTATAGSVILAQSETGTTEAGTQAAQASRAFLGVRLENTDGSVTITEVVDGSPAAEAGLQAGDILTAVNDTEVTTVQEAADAISALQPGDTVSLTYTRDGESSTAEAALVEAPANTAHTGRPGRQQNFMFDTNGLGLEYNSETGAWTITELAEDSPLAEAGLQSGDVISAVNGEALDAVSLMQTLMAQGADGSVTLTVERDGEPVEIEVPVETIAALAMQVMPMSGAFNMMPGMNGMQGMPNHQQGGPNGMFMQRFGQQAQNGRLGLSFLPLDEQVAADNNVTLTEGALVGEVLEASPAADAGVQAGDIITAVNGEAVDAEHTLRDRLVAYEPEDVITLDITRGDETLQVEVTLGQPEMTAQFFNSAPLDGNFGMMMPFGMNGMGQNGMPFGFQFNVPAAPSTGIEVPVQPNI